MTFLTLLMTFDMIAKRVSAGDYGEIAVEGEGQSRRLGQLPSFPATLNRSRREGATPTTGRVGWRCGGRGRRLASAVEIARR